MERGPGLVVGQRVAQDARRFQTLVVQVAQADQRRYGAAGGVETVVCLELACELLFQQAPRVVDEALQAVAGGLVESHEV